eukprot:CAMPEP_0179291016 /NCGR_PEP_ID=MMETSP0797-20121207/42122_1 /TAXON_ID=47934 /ORGANISM="Dinophysis acuminata, Strain DAEP01" /LENGTH=536 /DNA_ID=CAMNT_0021000083 /DNA_START=44 /DNA_END=1654 /DNA_ORIENTATION=+
MAMAVDAPPMLRAPAAMAPGRAELPGFAGGGPCRMPVKNTFVDIPPCPGVLRRLGTTTGRLEGNRGDDEDDGSTAYSSEGGAERGEPPSPPSSTEPGVVWASPVHLQTPGCVGNAQEGMASSFCNAPARESLDRLSTEALRERLFDGAAAAEVCLGPPAGEELAGLPAMAASLPVMTAVMDAMPPHPGELSMVQTQRDRRRAGGAELASLPVMAAVVDALVPPCHGGPPPAQSTPLTVKNTFVDIAPQREALCRLRTAPDRLGGGEDSAGEENAGCSGSEEREGGGARPPEPHGGPAQPGWAPGREGLDRLSTEALQESILGGMAAPPGACYGPWGVCEGPYLDLQTGMPFCAMLPLLPLGGLVMTSCDDAGFGPGAPGSASDAPGSDPGPAGDSVARFTFSAPASKLKTRDRMMVLEQFVMPLGGESLPFLVKVTAKQVHDRKCGQCFKTARGHGHLELKCEGEPPPRSEPISVRFIVGSGPRAEARGPVHHNFLHSSIVKLPADLAEWDFTEFIDPVTMTVPICVEIESPAPFG